MTVPPPPSLNLFQRWWLAVRPKTLFASMAPVLVGCGVAIFHRGPFRLGAALAALLVSVLFQIAANLINDVADYAKGTDAHDRLGPTRVTQAGILTPTQVWQGVGVIALLAAACGLYLTSLAGWGVILIGLSAALGAALYSLGPYPLSDYGLGDLFAMIFFGFVAVCGTVWVVSGTLPWAAWPAAVGVGALVTAILVVNNIRDIETDRRAGRINLPIRFGRQAGETEYASMLLLAFAVPLLLFILLQGQVWLLLVYAAVPNALRVFRLLRSAQSGPTFNQLLAKTSRLTFLYGGLLAAALALSGLIPVQLFGFFTAK